MLNLEAIRRAPVAREPFTYFTAAGVLAEPDLKRVIQGFPAIAGPGIFPLEELEPGPAFQELIRDIEGTDIEEIMEEKLGLDLSDYPLMVTVRGHCHRRDGRIHTDSVDKVATCLLYLNEPWESGGGRLRLLRNGSDIEDYLAEVPPNGGTLVAFKRSDNSWHGHLPYEGQRRYVMFNWVRSDAALQRNVWRHRVSASLKRLNPFR